MSSNDDELNWLAMRYVLDELSDSERNAFELRLANDLAACEAVAQATQLMMSLHDGLATPAVVAPPSVPIKSGWRSQIAVTTSLVTVACLFIAVAFWSGPDRTVSGSGHDAIELVSRWRAESMADAEEDDTDDDLQENSSVVTVPEWLLAGVSLEIGHPFENPPEEKQDN